MALSVNFDIIKNQSVTFTDTDSECDSSELNFNNIIYPTDVTQVQFELNPTYYADNLILYGDLTTASGWTLTNMTHNAFLGLFGSDGDSACSVSIIPNELYMPFGQDAFIKCDIQLIANTHGCDITVGTQQYSLQAGQIGDFTFYGILGDDTATNNLIKLESPGGTNQSFIVNYIYGTPIDFQYVFLIRNLADNSITNKYLLKNYFSFDYPTGTDHFRIIDNKITWTVDWGDLGLEEGCYQLEVCDPSINTNLQCGLPNQDFSYLETNTVDYDGGNIVAYFNGDSKISLLHFAGILGTFQIITNEAPEAGISYDYSVTFTDVDLSGGGITLTLGFVGDNDAHVITGASTKTGTVISDGGVFTFAIAMSSNASCKVSIAGLTLTNDQLYSGNYVSNGFTLKDGGCKTVLIKGCADTDNAFGLNFGSSSYELKGRVEGKFVAPQYKHDKSKIEYGENANKRNIYFKREKTNVLKLNLLPEYMLDFVSAVIGLDHFYVDGVEYDTTGDETFTLSYPDGLNSLGYAVLYLTKKDTTIEKSATIELGSGCSDTIDCVLDPETNECLIDPQTGDPVLMP